MFYNPAMAEKDYSFVKKLLVNGEELSLYAQNPAACATFEHWKISLETLAYKEFVTEPLNMPGGQTPLGGLHSDRGRLYIAIGKNNPENPPLRIIYLLSNLEKHVLLEFISRWHEIYFITDSNHQTSVVLSKLYLNSTPGYLRKLQNDIKQEQERRRQEEKKAERAQAEKAKQDIEPISRDIRWQARNDWKIAVTMIIVMAIIALIGWLYNK